MEKMEPLITIGIPTYNGEKYIAEAIESVINQTYQNLEIMIFDNCSTDSTGSVVDQFVKKDSRIKYVRQPSNIGYIRNFNSIAQQAKGDYVVFFADDDYYDKNFVKLLWYEFEKEPSLTMAIGNIRLVDVDGSLIAANDKFSEARVMSSKNLSALERVSNVIKYGHNREWSWAINLAMHKKECLLKHPYSSKLIDPGTLFYRSIIFEGNLGFNPNAIFYKRVGGYSGAENYGRPKETIKTKFEDLKNEVLQLCYETKLILNAKFRGNEKWKLIGVFIRYRLPELLKRNFLFTASLFSFMLVKKPYRYLRSLR